MANWIPILKILPRNAISQAFGVIARVKIPVFSSLFRNWFAKNFSIDLSDATKKLSEYANVHELFIRSLVAGARNIENVEIVSPVDGKLSQCGVLLDSELKMIQAKGKEYSLKSLIKSNEIAQRFVGGAYAVIYLAPFNYHRIHSPAKGLITKTLYCPGTLWPVNVSSVSQIDELFCVNERLTSYLKTENEGEVLVVKVGATNVGRITLAYNDQIITNSAKVPSRSLELNVLEPKQPISINAGDQLGTFELGSTVVIIVNKAIFERNPNLFKDCLQKDVRVGQSLV